MVANADNYLLRQCSAGPFHLFLQCVDLLSGGFTFFAESARKLAPVLDILLKSDKSPTGSTET